MSSLLAIYRNLRDSDRVSSVIIGRSIMYYLCIFRDYKEHRERKWYWKFGHYLAIGMLAFSFSSFLFYMPDHLATIVHFGEWLDIFTGTTVALIKTLFIIFRGAEISDALDIVAALDEKIREKALRDDWIRKRREWYFLLETIASYTALGFTILMGVVVYGIGMIESPIAPFPLAPIRLGETAFGFWLGYVAMALGCTRGGCVMVTMDFMVGNMYNQIILNLEILTKEIRMLERESELEKDVEQRDGDYLKERAMVQIVIEYQHLRKCVRKLNNTFQPVLLVVIMSNMLVLTFISMELAIVVNEDMAGTIRPGMFFFFMSTAFFYWCWLGQRLSDVSQLIPLAVYDFDWYCGGVRYKRFRIMIMQMTSRPLQILAKPFFELNYSLFSSVLRRAYSIMAVLKDVAKD